MIDGEVVALDESGRPSFAALQNVLSAKLPLYYYVFDVVTWRGDDLRKLPLSDRRRILEESVLRDRADPIRLFKTFDAKPAELLAAAKKHGLEGIIAKRIDSPYQ